MEFTFTENGKTTEGVNSVGRGSEDGENKNLVLDISFERSTRNQSKIDNKLLESSI